MLTKQMMRLATGFMLLGVQGVMAQIQPVASPVVNLEIPNAGPVVMNMRMAMRQAQSEISYENNLLITGNVGGNKHFRASVPYSATSALQTAMPSDGLSSFFRLTQPQDYRTSSPLAYTPYYSSSATTTHTETGQAGIITPVMLSQTPATTSIVGQPRQPSMGLPSMAPQVQQETLNSPQRRDSEADGAAKTPADPWLMPMSPEMERPWQLPLTSMTMDVVLPRDVNATWTQPNDPRTQVPNATGLDRRRPEQTQVREIEDPNASEVPMGAGYSFSNKMAMQAYTQTKFNTCMKAGETYLKQGQYDKADDAYTLADAYRSGDALAMAGKSHALLAKRAYSGSALYLIRVLQVLPDYAKTDIGLSEQLGGFEALKGHVNRLEVYTEGAHVPELKLLLAFIYVQVGDLGLAQKVLEDVPPDTSYEGARRALKEAARVPSTGVVR